MNELNKYNIINDLVLGKINENSVSLLSNNIHKTILKIFVSSLYWIGVKFGTINDSTI